MKANLEAKDVEYRGIIIESETREEKEVLERIFKLHGRPILLSQLMGNQVNLVIAPTPQLDGEGEVVAKGEKR